jgi:phosphatidylglycerophosphate synthase
MLDLWLRDVKEWFFQTLRVASWLGWLEPNHITVLSLLPGLLCAWFASEQQYSNALIAWAINRILDGLDGTIARATGKQSEFGGYLDIVIDFIVYGCVPLGLAVGNPSPSLWLWFGILQISYFVNAAGLFQLSAIMYKLDAYSTQELTTVNMPPALIEGTETVVFYSLFLLFPNHTVVLFGIFAAGVYISIIQRLLWARTHLPRLAEAYKARTKVSK